MILDDKEMKDAIERVNGICKNNPDKLSDALLKVFQDNCKILKMIDEVLSAPLQPGETPLDKLIERLNSNSGSNHES